MVTSGELLGPSSSNLETDTNPPPDLTVTTEVHSTMSPVVSSDAEQEPCGELQAAAATADYESESEPLASAGATGGCKIIIS